MPKPFVFRLHLIRVVDGDTLVGHLDLGMKQKVESEYVRLHGVDCPETRGRNSDPVYGPAATAFAQAWLDAATTLVVDSLDFRPHDSFGRVLGVVYRDDDSVSLNQALIDAGHAVPA